MASITKRSNLYHIVFRYGGVKFTRSLDVEDEAEAQAWRARLEETIRDIRKGKLPPPPDGADVGAYLLSSGRLEREPDVTPVPTVSRLFADYFASLPKNSLEESTLYTARIHRKHFERVIGANFSLGNLTVETLSRYAAERTEEGVGTVTIKKELATLRTVWNWGLEAKKLKTPFPRFRSVRLPKEVERSPFQTFSEIEQQIARGGLSQEEAERMWDQLYLRADEVEELLDHIEEHAGRPWLYPMAVAAAHTGARRSELLRSRFVDFAEDYMIIRERKRVQRSHTTRRVPMSSRLKRAMEAWMAEHPGGEFTFTDGEKLTPGKARFFFDAALAGSKWSVVKGWHTLRHSFISILASRGTDQRLIDEFAGHTSEEMRRRYRHIFPNVKREAIHSVFG